MLSQVIQVDDVYESVGQFGLLCYAGMVLQEQGGGYFFIDVDMDCPQVQMLLPEITSYTVATEEMVPKPNCFDCTLCIKPIPLRIGWFIVQAINLQGQFMGMSI